MDKCKLLKTKYKILFNNRTIKCINIFKLYGEFEYLRVIQKKIIKN
jgi:hypothetical protein